MSTLIPPAVADIASQAEAEAGVATDKFMTPERVAEAIAALVASSIVHGTPQETNSGTVFNFPIPTNAKVFDLALDDVSVSSTGTLAFRIGDDGGDETTGYISGTIQSGAGSPVASTTTLGSPVDNATTGHTGVLHGVLLSAATNTWCVTGSTYSDGTNETFHYQGRIILDNPIEQVSIVRVGSGSFNGGNANTVSFV